MVLLKMLGFLETSDSEMMRLGDRIRKNFKREIGTFLKQSFIEDLAICIGPHEAPHLNTCRC